jgi:hypothetical protein
MHHRMHFIFELLADASSLSGRATFRNVRVNDGATPCIALASNIRKLPSQDEIDKTQGADRNG